MTYLPCAHCHCEFLASERQVKRYRSTSGSKKVYCSKICLSAGIAQARRRPFPYTGTCPNCGTSFGSRYPKKFCSMRCYMSSSEFKEMLRANSPKATAASVIKVTGKPPTPRVEYTCLHCGTKGFVRASEKRRFCNHVCYRRYMAGRFDRWMASPQQIALPQSFDEFLLQEELPCLVEGCEWKGLHLGSHVNLAHGIPVAEFKRAAGFNVSTGLVTPVVAEALAARPHIQNGGPIPLTHQYHPPAVRGYYSLEAKEHGAKGRALAYAINEMPPRVCRGCGCKYTPAPGGYGAKFHSLECRNEWYKAREKRAAYSMTCAQCGKLFDGNKPQHRRLMKGLSVFCSVHCRQCNNSALRKAHKKKLQ